MSKLRSISTAIWSDPFIEELFAEEKLLFIYLITNEKTNMLGIYELSIKKMSFETGIEKNKIIEILQKFEKLNKVKKIDNYILLVNFAKHQNYNPNMMKSAISVYNDLPNSLKIKGLVLDKSNPSKSFETLLNHLGMVRKIEVEYEYEYEEEVEEKILDESVLVPDNFKNPKTPSLLDETQKSLNNSSDDNDSKCEVLNIINYKLDDFKNNTVEEIFSMYTKDKKDIVLNVALWNSFAKKYNKSEVYKITNERRKKLKSRLSNEDFLMDKILESAKSQSFAMDNNWFNFDFIIANETNYIKLLEKKYLNNEPKESHKGNFTIR